MAKEVSEVPELRTDSHHLTGYTQYSHGFFSTAHPPLYPSPPIPHAYKLIHYEERIS